MTAKGGWERLERRVVECDRCPRLRRHCEAVARAKKREYRDQAYWGKPVPGFGDRDARLWIVGLAPAAHGANRTGRMFTGDSSGRWLFSALHGAGFASAPESLGRDDGMKLRGAYISAVARCAPPGNKPLPREIASCEPYLDEEWALLGHARVLLALGGIAFKAVLGLLARHGVEVPRPLPRFAHGAEFRAGGRHVLASYHPSRQNTNTGRLTRPMWETIFVRARDLAR